MQLGVDVGDILPHSMAGETKLLGNSPVRIPVNGELKDLRLSFGQHLQEKVQRLSGDAGTHGAAARLRQLEDTVDDDRQFLIL